MEFSLEGFAKHLIEMAAHVEEAKHDALEKAARVVEREAKHEIGHYQDAVGPFQAWPELADTTKDDRVRLGYSENDPGLRSGEMGAGIGHTVEGDEAVVGSKDDEMVYFELGGEHQPARSVLAGAAMRKAEEVLEILGGAVEMALVSR
jgi:hypothetical protein